MFEFVLPDIGEGMHEGEILKWLVREGDSVRQDQPIVEVQTDKVSTELSSPITGVIEKVLFGEGVTVEVGKTLLLIKPQGVAGREAATAAIKSTAAATAATAVRPPQTAPLAPPLSPIPHIPEPAMRIVATPFVRQLARELGVDIERVRGTGPAGRVTEADIRYFRDQLAERIADASAADMTVPAEAAQPAPPALSLSTDDVRVPLRGMRKAIAEHMQKSATIIPHVTHVDEIEVEALRALRDKLKPHAERQGVQLTYLPFVIKALIGALKQYPAFNASFDEAAQEIVLKKRYNIGIATETGEGLLVPIIHDANRLTLYELAGELSRIKRQRTEGKWSREQLAGGTFSISNVGPYGGLHATPIINYPEAAILALHKMEQRMVVRAGQGVVRWMMNVSLSFDHRIVDGVAAVQFTNKLKTLLEAPELLMTEMV